MGILDEDVARVRESADIVAIAGEHIALKRVGRRYTGLCPFHGEKSPSFSINPELGLYYCFGCGAKGDAISFLREVEHLDFVEAVERLAAFDIPVDQVTYLDPHDFRQDAGGVLSNEDKGIGESLLGKPSLDGAPRQWTLGKPHGAVPATDGRSSYGATVWNNVNFADVYYQTTQEPAIASIIKIQDFIPEGRPIPGAYNTLVRSTDPGLSGFNDHGDIWSNYYVSTVKGVRPGSDGFGFSLLASASRDVDRRANAAKAAVARKDAQPNFFADGQDHAWSSPQLVKQANGKWVANADGLTALGVTEASVTAGRWTPEWNPMSVVNGGFASIGTGIDVGAYVPGWSNHGGSGRGRGVTAGGLGGALELSFTRPSRSHNRLFVPAEAATLAFLMRRTQAGPDDSLVVRVGDEVVDTLPLNAVDDAASLRRVTIPAARRGSVQTLSFDVIRSKSSASIADEAKVVIDDVRMATAVGQTGDLIPIDLSAALDDAGAVGPFSVTSAAVDVPGVGMVPLKLRVHPARKDVELSYADAKGDLLFGYLLFSDRLARGTGTAPFSKTGQMWFAPATGVYRRDLAVTTDSGNPFFLPAGANDKLPGDVGALARGFQGRLRLGVAAAGGERAALVEVLPGCSGTGDARITEAVGALGVASLQQRLNFWDGQTIGATIVAAADTTEARPDRPLTRPLIVDGIQRERTNTALVNFKTSFVSAGKAVELLVGHEYNHYEIRETFANPYGLIGRAVLQQMQLQ